MEEHAVVKSVMEKDTAVKAVIEENTVVKPIVEEDRPVMRNERAARRRFLAEVVIGLRGSGCNHA
jgi:hypothetical protein